MKEKFTVYMIKGGTLQFEDDFDFIEDAYNYIRARLEAPMNTFRFTIIETLIAVNLAPFKLFKKEKKKKSRRDRKPLFISIRANKPNNYN